LPPTLSTSFMPSWLYQSIYALLDETDIDDVSALAKAGAQIRQWIIDTPFQYGDTHTGQVSNHFTKGGIFAPNSVYIIHAELVIPDR
jgi:hypothetical protein